MTHNPPKLADCCLKTAIRTASGAFTAHIPLRFIPVRNHQPAFRRACAEVGL